MKKIKNLSQQIRWQLSLLALGLFIASLVLISLFSFHAIETTTKNLVRLEAETIVRNRLDNPNSPLPSSETETAYKEWEDIPVAVRRLFAEANIDKVPETNGAILEATETNSDGKLIYFYLHHHKDAKFGNLFLLSRYDADDIEMVGLRLFTATLLQSFWSSLIIFALLFFLIRWLIRRTSEPLVLLSQWADNLVTNPKLPLKTDFPIQELNQLAAQLREGVDKIETYNRREQEFLRYASHELRTPLGIIQASLDTLQLQADGSENNALARALKASDNARLLSNALLWLARESNQAIAKSEIELPSLIERATSHHRHLLQDQTIDIQMQCTADIIQIEENLFEIVVSNLIRNAFQHNTGEYISIEASANYLRITNVSHKTETPLNSFGLGLQLVQRICEKLAWQYDYREESKQVTVRVQWKDSP